MKVRLSLYNKGLSKKKKLKSKGFSVFILFSILKFYLGSHLLTVPEEFLRESAPGASTRGGPEGTTDGALVEGRDRSGKDGAGRIPESRLRPGLGDTDLGVSRRDKPRTGTRTSRTQLASHLCLRGGGHRGLPGQNRGLVWDYRRLQTF